MQTHMAQAAALAIYGNAFLSGRCGTPENTLAPSTLTFCEYVKFVEVTRRPANRNENPFAQNPADWVCRLKADGVQAIRIAHSPTPGIQSAPEHMLAGFAGGGGAWRLETIKGKTADHWLSRWEIGNQDHPDRKIWRVTYGRVAQDRPVTPTQWPDLDVLKRRLVKNLSEIAAFAKRQKLGHFAAVFKNGLDCLGSRPLPQNLFHQDLISSPCLPHSAAQLLAAIQSAWVFGGMGSWNDLGFDDEAQPVYDRLSAELYELLTAALESATNTSMPRQA